MVVDMGALAWLPAHQLQGRGAEGEGVTPMGINLRSWRHSKQDQVSVQADHAIQVAGAAKAPTQTPLPHTPCSRAAPGSQNGEIPR